MFKSCHYFSQNNANIGNVYMDRKHSLGRKMFKPNTNHSKHNYTPSRESISVPPGSELKDVKSNISQLCVFSEGLHSSENCFSAMKLPQL